MEVLARRFVSITPSLKCFKMQMKRIQIVKYTYIVVLSYVPWLDMINYLNTVIAGGNFTALNLNGRTRMCKFALHIRTGTLVPLEFSAHFKLQPPAIFLIE